MRVGIRYKGSNSLFCFAYITETHNVYSSKSNRSKSKLWFSRTGNLHGLGADKIILIHYGWNQLLKVRIKRKWEKLKFYTLANATSCMFDILAACVIKVRWSPSCLENKSLQGRLDTLLGLRVVVCATAVPMSGTVHLHVLISCNLILNDQ